MPLYRASSDEFALFLLDESFAKRNDYFLESNKRIDENAANHNRLVIVSGMSVYEPEKDTTILQVFTRANREMYQRKRQIKEKQTTL